METHPNSSEANGALACVRSMAAVVLLCHVAAAAWLAYTESPVWHEPAQLAAGLSWWRFGRCDCGSVNPPLFRVVASAPALFFNPVLDADEFDRPPVGRDEFARAERFASDNAAGLLRCLLVARLACIAFSVIGAYSCWRLACSLYGECAGFVAMGLWCFSPFILGQASIVMADVPAASLGVATVYSFWRWLKTPRWLEAIILGVVLGMAQLCKYTLLVLCPILPVLWLVYQLGEKKSRSVRSRWWPQAAMLAGSMLISVWIVNCGYLFKGTCTPIEQFRFQSLILNGYERLDDVPDDGANRFRGTWFGKLPLPFPEDMILGIDAQRYDFERGLPSYLRGVWADRGWWYYYLYALAVKMPLGTWCLLGLAICMTCFGCGYSASWRDELVVALPGLLILLFVSSQTGISVHSRYLLPALPFLFVWTSKSARVYALNSRISCICGESMAQSARWSGIRRNLSVMVMLVGMAFTWSVASSLSIFPHCLSYFNELAGVLSPPSDIVYPVLGDAHDTSRGLLARMRERLTVGPRNGPRHLLDSNIDWGQDLLRLKHWLDGHPGVNLDGLACFSSYPVTLIGLPDVAPPPPVVEHGRRDRTSAAGERGPRPGWYALSVNYLFDRCGQYRYFLRLRPVAAVGYSIYIYHVTAADANRIRDLLALPEDR